MQTDMQTDRQTDRQIGINANGKATPTFWRLHKTGRNRMAVAVSLACLVVTGMGAGAAAQGAASPALPADALASLIGEWQGTGWSAMPDGSRENFDIFERVERAAGGHVVMIRGEGFAPAGSGRDGRPVHDAAGFVSLGSDGYRMFAATARGGPESHAMTITETGYHWEIPLGPQGRVVFDAVIDGQSWVETGQYCDPQGMCYPTLEMTLTRRLD
ncbi:hypothetical protein [Maricaulis sp.]|uniref:hypothetical protein n=1 Tax=Maricaulis sp. TaxID=1486257 RepID=UPI0025BD322C|nr:hypothetical protein [Maricaulis sp.]